MADPIDLTTLTRGDPAAWATFVRRYAGLIVTAVRVVARDPGDVDDLVQDVFARLCKDEFRLLKTYDPGRSGLTTWLTIVARSTARDAQRRHRIGGVALEDVPEAALAVEFIEPVEKLAYPADLLSPRQREVIVMLYNRDMEVADVAAVLGVDAQTVRSMHHKAMLKLRAHFGVAPAGAKDAGRDGMAP